jgi:hypothetical protein
MTWHRSRLDQQHGRDLIFTLVVGWGEGGAVLPPVLNEGWDLGRRQLAGGQPAPNHPPHSTSNSSLSMSNGEINIIFEYVGTVARQANRRIPISHKYLPGDWTQVPHDRKQTGCHWTSETWYECIEIAGSPQGSPPAANYVSSEAGRRTCSEHETGTEELCETKWDYHIVGTTA